MEVSFVLFDEIFLDATWQWLQNEELRTLIDVAVLPTKEEQREWFGRLPKRKDYIIWGVLLEQKPIGVCGLKNINAEDGEYWGYIGEKQYWGKGIGTAMLHFVEEKAIAMKLENVYLHVLKSNSKAIKLYQNQQYKTIGETERMFFMQKQIRSEKQV